ncbi:hypothetical protein J8M21_13265 [Pseudoalteromonas luteoviolacea]|uniref:hypothetical protein n=1 Tax=Pseudoalteromonas luteoviolacea TaxID=43657 RepID=UPI001B39E70D|nr:hypothetical protein [Pseudoalteromonas luteoviolacea]MBQ4878178.1 hypothetical protein [Pseudoalteromonas luteoviolacea]MBQ4907333.1 hypothetical protein [Pseudoalteromonas luteoviolacea]
MNITLKKSKLKSLTKNSQSIAQDVTPKVAGGGFYDYDTFGCNTARRTVDRCVITGTDHQTGSQTC